MEASVAVGGLNIVVLEAGAGVARGGISIDVGSGCWSSGIAELSMCGGRSMPTDIIENEQFSHAGS